MCVPSAFCSCICGLNRKSFKFDDDIDACNAGTAKSQVGNQSVMVQGEIPVRILSVWRFYICIIQVFFLKLLCDVDDGS